MDSFVFKMSLDTGQFVAQMDKAKLQSQELGNSFKKSNQAATESIGTMKQALASLIASGQGSSEQAAKLRENIKSAVIETEKLNKAALSVEKEFEGVAKAAGKVGEHSKGVGSHIAKEFSAGFKSGNADQGAGVFGEVAATAGKAFGALANPVGAAVVGVGLLAEQAREAWTGYRALGKEILNIGTLDVERNGLSLDVFRHGIEELSTKVPDTSANIARGVYQAVSAGITGTEHDIVKFVGTASKVAVAGMSDTNTAVNTLTSIVNAYGTGAAGAEEASNVLFATIKSGKTTFPELAGSLYNVLPAASAAGVSFKEVSAALATLTLGGTPTAQATTQIRAAIIELQKPTGPLAAALAKIGLNAANVGDELKKPAAEGGGLINILQRLEKSATASGKSMTQIFSSVEASAAALNLTGKKADVANGIFGNINADAASGIADRAFDTMSQGMGVKLSIIKNQIEVAFTGAFDAIKPAISFFLDNFGGIAKIVGVAAAAFISFQLVTNASSIAMGIYSAAQGIATGLVGAFNAVLALSPLGAFAVALGIAVGAYALFHKSAVETAQAEVEQAEAQKKIIETQLQENESRQAGQKATQGLIEKYKELGSKANLTKKEQEELRETQFKLDKQYPGLIDLTKSYQENLSGVEEIGRRTTSALQGLVSKNDELRKSLAESQKTIVFTQRNAAVAELNEAFGKLDFSVWEKSIGGTFSKTSAQAKKVFDDFKDQKFDAQIFAANTPEELDRVNAKLNQFINANAGNIQDAKITQSIYEAIHRTIDKQREALEAAGVIKKEAISDSKADNETKRTGAQVEQEIIALIQGVKRERNKMSKEDFDNQKEAIKLKIDNAKKEDQITAENAKSYIARLNAIKQAGDKSGSKSATEFENAKALLATKLEDLKADTELSQNAIRRAAADAGRKLTAGEELKLKQLDLELAEKQLVAAREILKVTGEGADIKTGIKLDAKEKQKGEKEVTKAVSDLESKITNLKLSIVPEVKKSADEDLKLVMDNIKDQVESLKVRLDVETLLKNGSVADINRQIDQLKLDSKDLLIEGKFEQSEEVNKKVRELEELLKKNTKEAASRRQEIEISSRRDGAEKELALALLKLDKERDAAIENAKIIGADTLAIEQNFERKKQDAIRAAAAAKLEIAIQAESKESVRSIAEKLVSLQKERDQLLENTEATEEQRLAIKQRFNKQIEDIINGRDPESLKAKEDLDKEEKDLNASLIKRETSYDDYIKRIGELREKRAKLEQDQKDAVAAANIIIKSDPTQAAEEIQKATDEAANRVKAELPKTFEEIGSESIDGLVAGIAAGDPGEALSSTVESGVLNSLTHLRKFESESLDSFGNVQDNGVASLSALGAAGAISLGLLGAAASTSSDKVRDAYNESTASIVDSFGALATKGADAIGSIEDVASISTDSLTTIGVAGGAALTLLAVNASKTSENVKTSFNGATDGIAKSFGGMSKTAYDAFQSTEDIGLDSFVNLAKGAGASFLSIGAASRKSTDAIKGTYDTLKDTISSKMQSMADKIGASFDFMKKSVTATFLDITGAATASTVSMLLQNKNIGESVKAAGKVVGASIEDYGKRTLSTASKSLQFAFQSEAEKTKQIQSAESEKAKLIEKGDKNLSNSERERLKELTANIDAMKTSSIQAFIDVGAAAGAEFTGLLLQGENIGKAALKTALDLLDSMIPVFTAMIFGVTSSSPANIASLGTWGAIEFVALTATLKGLVAWARSSAGFSTGRHPERGEDPTKVIGYAHGAEDIFNAQISAKNRDLFGYLHKGGEASDWFVNNYGQLYKKEMRPQVAIAPVAVTPLENKDYSHTLLRTLITRVESLELTTRKVAVNREDYIKADITMHHDPSISLKAQERRIKVRSAAI